MIIVIISAGRPDLVIIIKKRICRIVDFAVSADHRMKLKNGEEKDKYHDLAKKPKNTLGYQSDSDTICNRCSRCNGYRRRKWTQRHEFKSWTRLIAFHIALIPLGKV